MQISDLQRSETRPHHEAGFRVRAGAAALRWRHGIELGVFLFLIVPSMILSFFVIRQGSVGFMLTAAATILRDLSLLSLVAYFLWRNGETPATVGWNFRNASSDVLLGIVLFVVMFPVQGMLNGWLKSAGLSGPVQPLPHFLEAQGGGETVLALLMVLVVAVSEEVIFRGYLIARLEETTGSTVLAVALSTVIFALGHGYEGTAGVATVGMLGLMFALVYLLRGSLVAPITMHLLQDLLGIVVLPHLR